jgi:hypothetical protein
MNDNHDKFLCILNRVSIDALEEKYNSCVEGLRRARATVAVVNLLKERGCTGDYGRAIEEDGNAEGRLWTSK